MQKNEAPYTHELNSASNKIQTLSSWSDVKNANHSATQMLPTKLETVHYEMYA